jgi:hypothetical protein
VVERRIQINNYTKAIIKTSETLERLPYKIQAIIVALTEVYGKSITPKLLLEWYIRNDVKVVDKTMFIETTEDIIGAICVKTTIKEIKKWDEAFTVQIRNHANIIAENTLLMGSSNGNRYGSDALDALNWYMTEDNHKSTKVTDSVRAGRVINLMDKLLGTQTVTPEVVSKNKDIDGKMLHIVNSEQDWDIKYHLSSTPAERYTMKLSSYKVMIKSTPDDAIKAIAAYWSKTEEESGYFYIISDSISNIIMEHVEIVDNDDGIIVRQCQTNVTTG